MKLLALATIALLAGAAVADTDEASTIVTVSSTGTLRQFWSSTSGSSSSAWSAENLSASVPGSTTITSAALCKQDNMLYLFVSRTSGVYYKAYSFSEATGKLTDNSANLVAITPTASSPSFQAVFCVDDNLYVVDEANNQVLTSTDFTALTGPAAYDRTLTASVVDALVRPRSMFASNTAGVLINMYFGVLGDTSSSNTGKGVYAQGVVPSSSSSYAEQGSRGQWMTDAQADKIAIDTSGIVWFTDSTSTTNNIKISTGAGAAGAQSSSTLFSNANTNADMRFSNNRLYFFSGGSVRFLASPVRTSAVAISSTTTVGTSAGTINGMAVYYAGSAVRPLPTLTALATALVAALLSRRFW